MESQSSMDIKEEDRRSRWDFMKYMFANGVNTEMFANKI